MDKFNISLFSVSTLPLHPWTRFTDLHWSESLNLYISIFISLQDADG